MADDKNMIQIDSIRVENFKSLVAFEVKLAKFNCLIGLNGAGKTTVLQFIDFLSRLMKGDMEGWLTERKWKLGDLKSKMSRKKNIPWYVEFSDKESKLSGTWSGTYNPVTHRASKEHIEFAGSSVSFGGDGIRFVYHEGKNEFQPQRLFEFQGSVISALRESLLPESILDCKRFFSQIKSLELLAPEYMRQRTRESSGSIGLNGQNLASFIHELSTERKSSLFKSIQWVYPKVAGIATRSLRSGWKELFIAEDYTPREGIEAVAFFNEGISTNARHLNDGMLRLIAFFAELQSDHQFLLFDEIENGINPELVEYVVDAMVTANKQVVVTTHSPMILNFLEDEDARRSVLYLYKTEYGETKAIPFFSIPSLAEKLTVMGPGEAFADTNLTELGKEIQLVDKGDI